MMIMKTARPHFVGLLLLLMLSPWLTAQSASRSIPENPLAIRVGALLLGETAEQLCFSSGFLEVTDRMTSLDLDRRLHPTRLDDADRLFEYPVNIMTGVGTFSLTERESANFAAYLQRGGFLLASASCSDPQWDTAFRALLRTALPAAQLVPMSVDHPALQQLYEIESIRTVRRIDVAIYAIMLDDELVGVYSPIGLNDSANMGSDCCCCGANEIRNARFLNASILIHALTR